MKKMFKEVGETITAAAYDKSAALEKKYFGEMKSKLAINDVDLPAFQEATRPVYKNYIDSQGDDWVKLVEATR